MLDKGNINIYISAIFAIPVENQRCKFDFIKIVSHTTK